MSLNTALEFASRGYAVLAVGPNKRPWTQTESTPHPPILPFSPAGTGTALLALWRLERKWRCWMWM